MSLLKFVKEDRAYVNEKHSKYDAKNYGVHIGMEVTIVSKYYDSYYTVKLPNGNTHNIQSNALDKIPLRTKREHFLELIEKAEEKILNTQEFIKETQAKVDFMDETESSEFDENEFKAYHTLTLIENGRMTKLEKARAIAALITRK